MKKPLLLTLALAVGLFLPAVTRADDAEAAVRAAIQATGEAPQWQATVILQAFARTGMKYTLKVVGHDLMDVVTKSDRDREPFEAVTDGRKYFARFGEGRFFADPSQLRGNMMLQYRRSILGAETTEMRLAADQPAADTDGVVYQRETLAGKTHHVWKYTVSKSTGRLLVIDEQTFEVRPGLPEAQDVTILTRLEYGDDITITMPK